VSCTELSFLGVTITQSKGDPCYRSASYKLRNVLLWNEEQLNWKMSNTIFFFFFISYLSILETQHCKEVLSALNDNTTSNYGKQFIYAIRCNIIGYYRESIRNFWNMKKSFHESIQTRERTNFTVEYDPSVPFS
jgi:hypothetical protein